MKLPLEPCRHPCTVWLAEELDSLATPPCDEELPLALPMPLCELLLPLCELLLGDELLLEPMLPWELLPLCELGEALLGSLDCGYALPLGEALLLGDALLGELLWEALLPGFALLPDCEASGTD